MRLVRAGLTVAVLWASIAGSAPAFGEGQARLCEASDSTRRAMKALDKDDEEYTEAVRQETLRGLEQLLAKSPDDVFLHIDYISTKKGKSRREYEETIERYKTSLDKHPGNSEYEFLYALALVDTDTPEALKRLKAVPSDAPVAPQVRLAVAEIHHWGKFADQSIARAELDAYLDACPGSLNSQAQSFAREIATPLVVAKYAAQLRSRLQKEKEPAVLSEWESVWKLDFIATPEQADVVRAHVKSDLLRLRQTIHSDDLGFLSAMRDGYRMVEDKESQLVFEDRILAKYPDCWDARSISWDRFEAEHPAPKAGDPKEAKQTYYRASLAQADAELKRKPENSNAMHDRFGALSELDGVSNEQLASAGEALRDALKKETSWYSTPPAQFVVAQVFVDRKIKAEEIPQLVAEGTDAYAKRRDRYISDRAPDEVRKSDAMMDPYMLLLEGNLLLDAAKELGKPEVAKQVMEQVAEEKFDGKIFRTTEWEVQGKWAELNGRKLDALLMYRASLDSRVAGYKPRGQSDGAKEGYERLWKELGGTDSGADAWLAAETGLKAASDGGWERVSKDLPDAKLVDLNGKTWSLSELKGKTVLINVWATWCGPCRGEHPYLQELYDKVKDRKDIAVMTMSVDDSIGDVAPYMKQKKYSFPVLLASQYMSELNESDGVPQNWIVGADGKWEWKQVGFGDGDGWEKRMLEKLEGK